jgi:hypothetical protein
MLPLEAAGSVLPEGLQFLKPGWWLLHVVAIALVFAYGYRKGRLQERRERREREREAEATRD